MVLQEEEQASGLDLSHIEGLVDLDMVPDPAQTWTEALVSVEAAP